MSDENRSGPNQVKVALKRLTLAEFVQRDPLLETAPLIGAIPKALRDEFFAKGTPRRVAPGTFIFRAGDMTGPLYLVLRGDVSLTTQAGLESGRVGKGEFFGESELVMPAPARRGNAVAVTEVDFADFSAEFVQSLLKRVPGLRNLLGEVDAGRGQAGGELDDFLNRW